MSPFTLPHILQPHEKLYFLHIPKTSGMSLHAILEQHFLPKETCSNQEILDLSFLSKEKYQQYRYYHGHHDYILSTQFPQKPLIITMLRDPVERVISLFEYWRRNKDLLALEHPSYSDVFLEAVSRDLDYFINSPNVKIRSEIENNQARRLVSSNDDPMENVSNSEFLITAKRRISEEFLFFGLVEKFDQSIDLLCHTLGWQPVNAKQHINQTSDRLQRRNIPEKTIAAIIEKNMVDYALYQFAQVVFQERYQAMVSQLLENQYEALFTAKYPLQEQIDLIFDQQINGYGWYPPETFGDGTACRWSGPQNISTLDMRTKPGLDYRIKIVIVYSLKPEILNSIRLSIDDIEIPLTKTEGNDQWGVFTGFIPSQVTAANCNLTRLVFQVDKTISPNLIDPENPDPRTLGLAFHRIMLTPFTQSK